MGLSVGGPSLHTKTQRIVFCAFQCQFSEGSRHLLQKMLRNPELSKPPSTYHAESNTRVCLPRLGQRVTRLVLRSCRRVPLAVSWHVPRAKRRTVTESLNVAFKNTRRTLHSLCSSMSTFRVPARTSTPNFTPNPGESPPKPENVPKRPFSPFWATLLSRDLG